VVRLARSRYKRTAHEDSAPMSFEEDIAKLNEFYFFREFTFSKSTFHPAPEQKLELADSLIWLDDVLIVYQLKQRDAQDRTSPDKERRWFEKKVVGQATRQIRDTLMYLQNYRDIGVRNHRGHTFNLAAAQTDAAHKLVVYLPHDSLPQACREKKHHRSRTAGVIHLIPANDYLGILRTLITPAEVAEYLSFREGLINRWERELLVVPEQALVGQYLHGDLQQKPRLEFVDYLRALQQRLDEWDMSAVISAFADRVTSDNAPTDYYHIVSEIAKLTRDELREFKSRFGLAMERAKANEFARPYRMACPRTACGFIFIPLIEDLLPHRSQGLQNFTYAHKYDLRLPKCIGISFALEEGKWFSIEWCYMEFPWQKDPEFEDRLRRDNPLRNVRAAVLQRYTFKPLGK